MEKVNPGLVAELEYIVTEADTAARWGSGLVPVFSTPALVGLMESTAVRALEGMIDLGKTTVGGRIDIRHLAATPVGMKVRARAELVSVDGRKLGFRIQAWDEVELIGEAEHDRYIITEAKFLEKVEGKRKSKAGA